MDTNFVGIEIGGTKLQLVAGDAMGTIAERHRISVDPRLGASGIRAQIEKALPNFLGLTNQLTSLLANGVAAASNLNALTAEARPVETYLGSLSAQLRGPGTFGDWMLGSNGIRQLNSTFENANLTVAHHPILPLICDTNAAKPSLPHHPLPKQRFAHPEDAEWHVEEAIKYHTEQFGMPPRGMWPGEGSVAQPVLELLRSYGILWTASDVRVLQRSPVIVLQIAHLEHGDGEGAGSPGGS